MPKLKYPEEFDYNGQPDPVVNECIDYNQIKSWIHRCEQNHDERFSKAEYQSTTGVSALKLVDVIDLKVVDASPGVRYFALSYMWGGVEQFKLSFFNFEEPARDGALNMYIDEVPVTIRDAMQFVKGCGERNLWVDSLCIVQYDGEKKYAQIEQMGSIYNEAAVTLIAGTGCNANAPLAGVRPWTRTPETKKPKYRGIYVVEPGVQDRRVFRKPRDGVRYEYLGQSLQGETSDLVERLSATIYNSRA